MNMMSIKKFTVAVFSTVLLCNVVSPLSAFASTSQNISVVYTSNTIDNLLPTVPTHKGGQYEENGVKKWIAKAALQATAKALRSGGKLVSNIAEDLGGSEATYFIKHTDTIADALDDLVQRGDVVEDAIIDTVSTALISAEVPVGISRTIANVFTFVAF